MKQEVGNRIYTQRAGMSEESQRLTKGYVNSLLTAHAVIPRHAVSINHGPNLLVI
ncbi:hypothetical protein HanIR_Chr09g0404301 [Helianthus annuus]|nr:hypothetical protein HanIR_Chr09g0404301 [Helianthus annuus]